MLEDHNKATLTDLKRQNDVTAEINFSKDPDLKECVKLSLGGKEAIVSVADLYTFIFMVANEDQQADLVPVKQTTVRKIVKRHTVQVTKPLKPGDLLHVRCETNVPVEIFEGIVGAKRMQNPTTKATSFAGMDLSKLGK